MDKKEKWTEKEVLEHAEALRSPFEQTPARQALAGGPQNGKPLSRAEQLKVIAKQRREVK